MGLVFVHAAFSNRQQKQRKKKTHQKNLRLQAFIPSIKAAYPDLAPLALAVPPVAAHAAAVAAAGDMAGWEVTHRDEAALTLTAVATTPLLRFRDDVAVRVRPAAKGPGSVVDVRVRFGVFFSSFLGRCGFGKQGGERRKSKACHPPTTTTPSLLSRAHAWARATWAPTRPASGRT